MVVDGYYTVQASDLAEGLVGIARRLYGTSEHWMRLYEANSSVIGANPSVLRPGQHLRVPELDAASHPVRLHIVEPWELLGGLAGIIATYPDCMLSWQQVYAINRGIIGDNPQQLNPGQRLLIPTR